MLPFSSKNPMAMMVRLLVLVTRLSIYLVSVRPRLLLCGVATEENTVW